MQYPQQFNLRIDDETAAALKRLAAAMRRSQANVVRWLILAEAARLESLPGQSQVDKEAVQAS